MGVQAKQRGSTIEIRINAYKLLFIKLQSISCGTAATCDRVAS